MSRLIVLDALGLAYRAYYAFIGRPLTKVVARASVAGTARLRNLEISTARGPRVAASAGGALEIVGAAGAVREAHEVPLGAFVQVADGDRVGAGQVLLAQNTSAIFGFANTALKLRREQKPDRWALAWDGPGPTIRHETYAEYKATRKPMPDDLAAQLGPIEELAQWLGLPVIEQPGMEADDVMATLARRGAEAGYEVILVTGDKDMLQVVGERVTVLVPPGKGEEYARLDPEGVREEWKVEPGQIRDVLALMGDSVDNIPGVPGVGRKTAVELIARFGSLEAIYRRLDEVTKPALRQRLAENRERAFLSRDLATVHGDLDLGLGLDDLPCAPIRRDDLLAFARRWEIRRLEAVAIEQGVEAAVAGTAVAGRPLGRRGTAAEQPGTGARLAMAPPAGELPAGHPAKPGPAATVPAAPATQGALDLWSAGRAEAGAAPVTYEGLVERLHEVRARAPHGLALLPLPAGEDPRTAPLAGLALAARDGTACYLPLAHDSGPNLGRERVVEWLAPAFADARVPKVAEDLKRDAHLLAGLGLELEGMAFDAHLGSFLCDPERAHDLESLARDFLGRALPPPEPPAGPRRARGGAAALPVAQAAASMAARAAALFPLADALRAQLEARDQWSLYETLEQPLVPVLLGMERAGVAIDVALLAEMASRTGEEIGRLRGELLAMAGGEVNLDSGPQVAKVLFETLGLKPGGRTPSGALSTRSEVLEELAPRHPFPARLLEYRALTKLKSTYFDALPRVVDPRDGRVHTTFEQTGAATGRLSSREPNLQNIPFRTPQGRAIRRAFVAPGGASLVGADYSQIELRVMAHLSGDPNLIEAFALGQDVHESTARRIFGVAAGSLDPELRARAKVVNFGIMYGMGARSLSQQMGIGLPEAQDFIASYFRVYARVREYLDGTVEEARRRGFVATLLGRRRHLPELASGSGARRAFAERAAINTPIQGSAADLMKLAMIRVHRALKQRRPSARLLLQVHDELLLECPSAEVEAVSELVRGEMEGCFALRVPLTVSLGSGPTWFDVH